MADKMDHNSLLLKNFMDRKNDSYAILQLPAKCNEKYRPLGDVLRAGKTPAIGNYNVVYVGALNERNKSQTVMEVLEQLYAQFNFNHPSDFTGHSLYESDVVLMKQNGIVKSFYYDCNGFTEMPQFFDTVKPEPATIRSYSDCPSRAFIAIIGYDEEDEEFGDEEFEGEDPGDYLENEFSHMQEMGDSRLSLCDWALTDADSYWAQYIRYLVQWAIDHSGSEYRNMSPAGYPEWLANEYGEG